jgi:hypothetical protein
MHVQELSSVIDVKYYSHARRLTPFVDYLKIIIIIIKVFYNV